LLKNTVIPNKSEEKAWVCPGCDQLFIMYYFYKLYLYENRWNGADYVICRICNKKHCSKC